MTNPKMFVIIVLNVFVNMFWKYQLRCQAFFRDSFFKMVSSSNSFLTGVDNALESDF